MTSACTTTQDRRATPPRSGPRRASRPCAHGRRYALWLATVAASAAGCNWTARDPAPDPDEWRLREIERLACVPPGRFEASRTHVLEATSHLLVDLHEVTRADWLAFAESPEGATAGVRPDATWVNPRTHQWPATGMNLLEAQAYAATRGMRLPTVSEWGWCAVGPRGQAYPFGLRPMESVANTQEQGLGGLVPVGTFLGGRSTGAGLLDLAGNAAELAVDPPQYSWVARASRYHSLNPELAPPLDAWAMGGSHRDRLDRTHANYTLFARELEALHRAQDVGLRCVVEAETWLRPRAPSLSRIAWRGRLLAIGERWGRGALPFLDRLASEDGATDALAWLLEGARR